MAPHLNATELDQGNCVNGSIAPPRLPVIDLSELDGLQHDHVVEALAKAAEKFGFFQVVNHGIPVEFLEELKDSVYEFFNQPEEKKAVYIPREGSPTRQLATYEEGSGSEPIDVLILSYAEEQDALKYWPDSCKEVTLEYRKSSGKLAERILRILMSNLGVTLDDSMANAYMGDKDVSFNHYTTYSTQNLEVAGVRKHTDTSTITVLLQDHIGGLFAQLSDDGDLEDNYKGEWVEIKPIAGALIVLAGDSLQVLSNGIYKAAEHYVQTTGRVTRVSVPAFMKPMATATIGPLRQAVEKNGGKARYREFLFEEYMTNANNSYNTRSQGTKAIHAFEIGME